MTTAAQLITRVRARLDEDTAKFWTDAQLLAWINEAMRDAGRYTKHITDTQTVTVVSDTSEYTLSADVLEVEHVYLLTGDGRQVPLIGQAYDQMNSIWGSWQNLQTGEPRAYSLWGTPPNLKLKLFPTPVGTGQSLRLLVRRLPTDAASTAATIDFPPAWDDLIEDYVEMAALRRARDPRWQEAFQMYAAKRDNLDVNSDYDSNPVQMVFDGYAGLLPQWLVDPRG